MCTTRTVGYHKKKIQIKWICCVFIFSAKRSGSFLRYENKRLTTAVMKTIAIDAAPTCVNYCLATDGCLAVNFLAGLNRVCELISGHITMSDLLDADNSDVYINGKFPWKL